ncbi:MAG: replication restart helicase PriA [Acidobacteriota bacterium]
MPGAGRVRPHDQTERRVAVALPVPALGLLTYRVPSGVPVPATGVRVVVPLGRRTLTGVVMGEAAPPDAAVTLRDLIEILDEEPFLPADVCELAAWVADYYVAGPGASLAVAMPPNALSARRDMFRTVRTVALTAQGQDVADQIAVGPRCSPTDAPRGLGTRQREALATLRGLPGGLPVSELAALGVSSSVISRLQALGLVHVGRDRVERDPFATGTATLVAVDARPPRLTDEQAHVVATLTAKVTAGGFQIALLHGVTGSGKTEVYCALSEEVRRAGRGVLVLVPEIGLTPAAATLFRARFGSRVAIQHSGLSDGERHDQWHRIRRGDVDVVVGTRSAVFAPIDHLGLIVVDEEHDGSYKQEETPRYHGRDVAVMRGKLTGALVVLGSATPSMESYYNTRLDRYALVRLTRRVADRPLAAVRVVNMREEYAAAGSEVVVSRALADAMRDRLDRGDQVLVLLNRRGYATSVFCRQCGGTMECPNCSVSLTVHTGRTWRARCHYCSFSRLVPRQCVVCAAPYLEHVGIGTERVEAEIAALLPGARLGRVDRDNIRRRGSLTELLSRFASREIDVLVGTQMIAKGHDFPHVTLVGVISADVGLGLADFRAAERTFQLLTQVSGRAGRGERAGEAIIQTLFPDHYSITLATTQDYPAFFDRELQFRQAMRYPPTTAMVNVVVRHRSARAALDAATDLAEKVARHEHAKHFRVLGPAPAPLTRLRGEHRAQFFLKGRSRKSMRLALVAALRDVPDLARRLAIDVDPLSVL